MSHKKISIVDFQPNLSSYFRSINEEWITEMFRLEAKDQKVLNDPLAEIIQPGGHILFAECEGLGIVGTGALLKSGESEFELTKMGVLKSARGLKAGEALLKALIARAKAIKTTNLYLLTNKKCEAAIELYEKQGFVHDKSIMDRFGREYDRCDVAMKYPHYKL